MGLELFGDNTRQQFKFYNNLLDSSFSPGAGKAIIGKPPSTSWVAEIIDMHPRYKFERRFLRPKKDYTHTNGVGSRGIFAWYVLEQGRIYDVQSQTSWRSRDRYFCRVNECGDIERIGQSEVIEWLKNHSE